MAALDQLVSWNSDWGGLRVAVLGLGVSGFAAADTLAELGSDVVVVAGDGGGDRRGLLDVLCVEFVHAPDPATVPIRLEDFSPELVIVSPGYHPDHALLRWAEAQGIPIWGDIELAWRVRDKVNAAEWICVTGTNGKTTTTQLTAAMLVAAGVRAAPAGNIGIPVLDAVRDPGGFDVLVIELSSYQLHWMNRNPGGEIVPLASVCLNLDEDHLDWHGGFEPYRLAKANVYRHTRIACVYNLGDEQTRRMVEDAEVQEGCRAIGFGLGVPGPSDFGVVDDILVDRAFLEERRSSALEIATLGDLEGSGLLAPHSVANVLAASALARAAGAEPRDLREAVREFRLDAHRTSRVATISGVDWVDDSKATNPHAANASLTAFESVVWIVGGLLKGVDIAPLVATHSKRLRAAVVIGLERSAVVDAFARHAPQLALIEVDRAETGTAVMDAAVSAAAELARAGDTVLLAPSAASMDQFHDYADRGREFVRAVEQLAVEKLREGGGPDDDAAPGEPPLASG